MTAYIDASVVLRLALGQPNALREWSRIQKGVSSALVTVRRSPWPTELGTLDAIHLATAILWKDMTGARLVMATHDAALGLGARAHGLPVIGVPTT